MRTGSKIRFCGNFAESLRMKSPENPVHIAFLSVYDARDKRSWSGIPYYIAQSLGRHCGEVHYLGPFPSGRLFSLLRAGAFLLRKLTGKRFDYVHSTFLARHYGRYFTARLREGRYDVVMAPVGSSVVAFLQTDLPVVLLSDTTFANMIDYYPAYSRLFGFSRKMGMEVERRAFQKASALLFPSHWAAESAVRDFGVAPEKVHLLPLGANLDTVPAREEVLARRKTGTCRLLFLGVDWERKGGSIAFETLLELRRRGIPATLTIIGCVPPDAYRDENLLIIPFLNKNDPEQRKQLNHCLLNADFLILPTRAECYGIVFAEASAYGLPSITTRTGGIAGVVTEGVNGFLLPPEAKASAYADKIAAVFGSDELYYSLVLSSRERYEESLNWDAWAEGFREILETSLPKRPLLQD
jgi:glycosyltransferase involved in cell wall biosynthesis